MFKRENPTWKNNQIEIGHDKKLRVNAKDKFIKKRQNLKKKMKKEKIKRKGKY